MRTCASEKRSCFQRSSLRSGSVPERREKLCPYLTKAISRFIGLGRKIRKRVRLRKLACPQRLQAVITRNRWTGLYLAGDWHGKINTKVVSFPGDQQNCGKLIQNPRLNIVECIEGLDNLKKYLISQRSDDNFKIFVDSVTTLDRDLGIDPEFSISKLRKNVYLFTRAVMNQLQTPSNNSRSLQLMDDLTYYLSAIRYSTFCISQHF
ncbi:hypothetical protein TNIN_281851 [Trichonephila inaurata madagascariensis]|uniref:Uncharacterized protein n=1 Tax=Trichonephila inaurata madagascariensis TaxID=2747483 RepID=A0A8X6X8I6_9ARAC|nr:hypothetical protein TNIN_281851 [Trichonephila inaurata madagascariensis]